MFCLAISSIDDEEENDNDGEDEEFNDDKDEDDKSISSSMFSIVLMGIILKTEPSYITANSVFFEYI